MKQYRRKITGTASAILIALTLFGLNTDQAIAQRKARKGAKGHAGSNAKIAKPSGSKQVSMLDYEGNPVVTYRYKDKMAPSSESSGIRPRSDEE